MAWFRFKLERVTCGFEVTPHFEVRMFSVSQSGSFVFVYLAESKDEGED
jgi:hypothetical protein